MFKFILLLMTVSQAEFLFAAEFKDIEPILIDNCQTCHTIDGVADFLPLENLDQVKENRDLMMVALEEGRMPYGDPNFLETNEGKKLFAWLKAGDEFSSPPPTPVTPPLILKDPRLLTFSDVEPLLKKNCGGCHRPGGRGEKYEILKLSFHKKRSKKVWDTLDDQEMPPGNRDFIFGVEGRIIMSWLRYSNEVGDR